MVTVEHAHTGTATMYRRTAVPAKQTVANAAKPARKRTTTTPRSRRRKPDHAKIAERAYYLHLEQDGRDELENWLRAERELTAA